MDPHVSHSYEKDFEIAFLRAKGDAFQTFFEQLMGRAFRADFMACRPWGNVGDKKNDGFLKSDRRLFQVYAPNDMTAAEAINKITEDFAGALKHWGAHFDKWSFVHNAYDGLPPHVHQLLLETERKNPGVKIEPWCLEELRVVFRRLSLDDLRSWFNYMPPTMSEQASIGFEEIRIVLEDIAARVMPANHPVMSVDPSKLRANRLSDSVQALLTAGMAKTPLVKRFFDEWHAPTYGERMAKAFTTHYQELKSSSPPLHPNEIFHELQQWTGGEKPKSSAQLAAVLAVLAYFFERCDIFEPAPSPAL
ncbi:MAG TPA: hypothetical protein DIT64_11950 [Verrucomicrobiales bacterium]|nr:hypothetical protein [Verrucomicrobiales bacterium]